MEKSLAYNKESTNVTTFTLPMCMNIKCVCVSVMLLSGFDIRGDGLMMDREIFPPFQVLERVFIELLLFLL